MKVGKGKIQLEAIRDLYLKVGTVKVVAEEFQLSERTVRRCLKKAGLVLRRGLRKGQFLSTRHFGCLAKWLREHPEEKLPSTSPSEISFATGCSQNAVKSYLYRRRRELKTKLKKLDFHKKDYVVVSKDGKRFPAAAIESHKAFLNMGTLRITLHLLLKQGTTHVIEITEQELDKLIEPLKPFRK
jgi:hypothetical protein